MTYYLEDGQLVRFDKVVVDQTLQLRHSVLWPDMPLSTVYLPEDESGNHYGAFIPHRDKAVAVISLFVEEVPIDKDADLRADDDSSKANTCQRAVRFRKFACDPEYQGKGIGTHLLLYSLSIARSELDATIAWCDARTKTRQWYKRRGLVSSGGTFYKGSVEYVRMKIDLRDLVFQPAQSIDS